MGEAVLVDLICGDGSDDAVGGGAQGGGAAAIFQPGAFPHDRAGAEVADLGAVNHDGEYSVEQQVLQLVRTRRVGIEDTRDLTQARE